MTKDTMWNRTLASLVGKDTGLLSEVSSSWEVRLDKWDGKLEYQTEEMRFRMW